ncbi:hypothetical protein [Mucilaginibacter sp. PAMB04168]|uniref:hypothetical protein n=1 Tax=Mucilaginibacter sp. PAMB04168 TaxID=3138567 RepID=UPI0031F639E8
MTLTAVDINQIKQFVSKRGFTEPDLQMEIIDHVCCRVEELMAAKPTLLLTDAIGLVHSEFGPLGFSVFEDSMRSNLRTRYLRMFKQNLYTVVNWKTIPLMLGIGYLLSILFNSIQRPQYLFGVTGFLMLLVLIFYAIANEIRFKRYSRMLTFKTGNSYLLISTTAFQVYNLLFIQLKVYQRLQEEFMGIVWALVILLLSVIFYAINKTQLHAIEACKELEEKYTLVNG